MKKIIAALFISAGLAGSLLTASAASAAGGPAVVNQAQASQAVVPAVTCGGYGMMQDNSYGSYRIRSNGGNQDVQLSPGNQTNYCKEFQVGSYYELIQYGTNLCLTYSSGSLPFMTEKTCAGVNSQYFTISSGRFISLYSGTCATNYNNIANVLVSFASCPRDSWTFT